MHQALLLVTFTFDLLTSNLDSELYVALVIYFVFLSLFIFELENSHVSTE